LDYVVFGTGFGATILVLGLLIRDFGPRLRYRTPADGEEVLHAEALVARVAWTRYSVALGSVLALAGVVVLIVTLTCILLVLSDSTGGWVMIATLAVLLLLIAFWTWAYVDRFGSYGILPERPVEPEAPVVVPTAVAVANPGIVGTIAPPSDRLVADEAGEGVCEEAPAEEGAVFVGPLQPDATDILPAGSIETSAPEAAADGAPPDETPDDETRLETPEERLAHAESPLDHGSAEAELDIVSSPARSRPSARLSSRSPERDANGQPAAPASDSHAEVDAEKSQTDDT
jgi:hypothetical protein